jgi:exodeoxyribonuclease V gamma subunit
MNGFFIHTGNRLEELARLLAAELDRPGTGEVLRPEVAVVPGRGTERWLKLFLARENGIAANLDCPFPQTFIEERIFSPLRLQLDPAAAGSPFAGDLLTWRIFFSLDPERDLAGLDEVAGYLEATGDELSRFQLARRLAELFQRYLGARPELIRAWDRGRNPLGEVAASGWQKELWRRVSAGAGKLHFAALHELFNQLVYPEVYGAVGGFSEAHLNFAEFSASLPPRLFLFGFSSLPLVYLDIFYALSRLVEVHLFYLNPCSDYWGDQYRAGIVQPGMRAPAESAFHPLLAAWGRQGRAFFEAVATLEVDRYSEHFTAPAGQSLLAALQRTFFTLADPDPEKLVLAENDRSLEIHRCHTRRREVEILYDVILAALDDDPDLDPDEIVVLAPDLELYRPYIEAVFRPGDAAGNDSFRLPLNLAPGGGPLRLPAVGALLELLRLLPGRLPAAEVFDLFSREVVCRRFGVDPGELEKLSFWLREAGVSWGLDAEHRAETSEVAFAEHSLAWGLERLLAGYGLAGNALRGDDESLLADLNRELSAAGKETAASPAPHPLPGIEGSEARVLGGFCAFVAALAQARKRLLRPLAARRWKEELENLVAAFIAPEERSDPGLELLDRVLAGFDFDLARALAGEDQARLGLETVQALLEEKLAGRCGRGSFFAGGISFASLLELKGLPAAMICVLGLNDNEFPRLDRPPAYDLIAARPRPGDRTTRDEDRYLFLETLLAARKRLVLSYLGRDPGDNRLRPASLLLEDLLEYLEERFAPPAASGCRTLADYLLFDHPPQPFSRRYFEPGSRFFTYSASAREMAVRLAREDFEFTSFRRAGLECELVSRIGLSDLVEFFRNPAAWFCRQRLRIKAAVDKLESFPESEPFTVDALENYDLSRRLTAALLNQDAGMVDEEHLCEALYRRFAAAGRLPLGARGRELFRRVFASARELVEELRPLRAEPLPALSGRLPVVVGRDRVIELDYRLDNLYRGEDGVIRQFFSRPVKKYNQYDRVRSVIHHLVLEQVVFSGGRDDLAKTPVSAVETCFRGLDSGKNGCLNLPLRDAAEASAGQQELSRLSEYFLEGSTRALPFLPALSLEWYQRWSRDEGGGLHDPVEDATGRVLGMLDNDFSHAARDDYFQSCFAAEFDDPDFWSDFVDLALNLGPVFMPT